MLPRPRQSQLRADEARPRDDDGHEGAYSRAQLMRMDGRFRAAMAHAGETPTTAPDRVAESLLPRRVP